MREHVRSNPSCFQILGVVEMPASQSGVSRRRPALWVHCRWTIEGQSEQTQFITRSDIVAPKGKKWCETGDKAVLPPLEARYRKRVGYFKGCNQADLFPETKQPLTVAHRAQHPWLGSGSTQPTRQAADHTPGSGSPRGRGPIIADDDMDPSFHNLETRWRGERARAVGVNTQSVCAIRDS